MKAPQTVTLLAALVAMLILSAAAPTLAMDFGEVGVGTQVLVVDGDEGSLRGLGFNLRTRFLWILGLDFTATQLDDSEQVWQPSAYRLGLMIHAYTNDWFDLYMNPGLSSDEIGGLFDPVGDTTWYRLGGGAELRIIDTLALGFEVHWTLPGEHLIEQYVDQNQDQLIEQYLTSHGYDMDDLPADLPSDLPADLPTDVSDVPMDELLELLPLDRLEFTFAARFYF